MERSQYRYALSSLSGVAIDLVNRALYEKSKATQSDKSQVQLAFGLHSTTSIIVWTICSEGEAGFRPRRQATDECAVVAIRRLQSSNYLCFEKNMPIEKWLERRGYVHFDRPIAIEQVDERVRDPNYVAKHSFMPLIGYTIEEPRYKRSEREVVLKPRPIRYASHLDSHVFGFYAALLEPQYEEALAAQGLTDSVLAYRKHALPGSQRGKCNIHFANEAFEWIKQQENCVAFAFDVEGFFDSIDHLVLKERWRCLLGTQELANDHYRVFRAITKYSWVELDKMSKALGFGRNRLEKSREPFCRPKAFRENIAKAGLIEVNRKNRGIPQGSPISSLLSNLAMFHFDCAMAANVASWGGLYRRYSDDILVVVPTCLKDQVSQATEACLSEHSNGSLTLNTGKTVVSSFLRDNGILQADEPLSYLGFEFDGRKKLIRPKTLARFQRRMIQAVRSAARAARKAARNGGSEEIYRRELYERFSHKGKRNFIKYAYRCAEVMNAPEMKRQTRRHWEQLHRLLENHITD